MNTHIPVMLPEICGILGKAQNLSSSWDATLGSGVFGRGPVEMEKGRRPRH